MQPDEILSSPEQWMLKARTSPPVDPAPNPPETLLLVTVFPSYVLSSDPDPK